jgi:hypothetical protein
MSFDDIIFGIGIFKQVKEEVIMLWKTRINGIKYV